jgi:hypothetical protein
MLSKAEILARPLPSKVVDMPEWQGPVTVRRLTAKEFLAALTAVRANPDQADALWLVHHVFDESGKRIFNDVDAPIIHTLMPFDIVERLTAAILSVNPDREAAAKNSPTPPST